MRVITEVLWGDRFWWVKIAIGLLVFALLSRRAQDKLGPEHPGLERLRLHPEQYQGHVIYLRPRPIVRAGDGEFEIAESDVPIRVVAPGPWTPGEWVRGRGVLRGDHIEAGVVRRLPHYPLKRITMYVLSAVVALIVAVLYFRKGRPALEKGLFVSRY